MKQQLIIVGPFLLTRLLLAAEDVNSEIPAPPPAYQNLRFNEDYSYLANPANRTDWFDSVKYIPLWADDPSWYLSFGGELRERVESIHDENFGIGSRPNSFLLQRITFLGDLHLSNHVRVFACGISGLTWGESQPASPVQDDPIDLLFAFIEIAPYVTTDERLAFRVGRFGMYFGSGRLIATRAAPNIPNRFDGFEALYTRPLWNITAFLTQPVKDTGHFDGPDHSITFWGLYATHYFDAPHTLGLDLYYLGIHRDHGSYASGTADEHRHSFGAREFGAWNHWDWNAEQVLQVGSFGNNSILAWTAAIDAGYTWDTTWEPRLGLKTGVTSGDQNSNDGPLGTFDALFFKSGYFNDASAIRPQNIMSVHPTITVKPSKTLSVDGGVSPFWRYTRNDAVYGVPGFISIPAIKTASNYVATACDVNFTWQPQRHVAVQASYVHFFTGSYVDQAGGKDVNYVSTTLSFLF